VSSEHAPRRRIGAKAANNDVRPTGPAIADRTAKPPLESNLKSSREPIGRLLTPRDAASFLRLSSSWLAKARMRGDGPPYVKLGRTIRYVEGALVQWTKGHQRQSTSGI
jgi:hypothetical protein